MIKQDYLLKIIEEFFESLSRAIHGTISENSNDPENRVCNFYGNYFQAEYTFFYENEAHIIFAFLKERCHEEDFPSHLAMLAELLYQDAMLKGEKKLKSNLLQKSLSFLEYAQQHSDTYSIERVNKIDLIKSALRAD